MRPIESLLLLANLLTFLMLALGPHRAPRWMRWSALIALLIAGAQVLAEGPRWQMVPSYALSGLFFLVWLLRRKSADTPTERGWTRRFVTLLAVGVGALALLVSIALPAIFPVFRFPRPTGPYQIGTTTHYWVDSARPEIFTADPNDRREVIVQIWYPAKGSASSKHAPYVSDPRALASLAHLLHFPPFALGHFKYVETHAVPSAPAAGDSPHPVLLLSPGRGGFRQDFTHLVEELVSHGYVVAGIDHPYASSGVIFPDGRLVTLDARLLPGPTGGLPADRRFFDDVAIPYLARDVMFALGRLAALNQADPNGILTGRLDLRRAGMLGPSLGGLVGAEACHLDDRLRACLAMDVHMPADVARAGLRQPAMFISRDVASMQLEKWPAAYIDEAQNTMRATFDRLSGDGYLVLVRGTFHANFSDAPLYSPLMSRLGVTGPIDAHRAIDIIDSYTMAFFDRHLRGRPAPLLDGPAAQYPDVLFETRRH